MWSELQTAWANFGEHNGICQQAASRYDRLIHDSLQFKLMLENENLTAAEREHLEFGLKLSQESASDEKLRALKVAEERSDQMREECFQKVIGLSLDFRELEDLVRTNRPLLLELVPTGESRLELRVEDSLVVQAASWAGLASRNSTLAFTPPA